MQFADALSSAKGETKAGSASVTFNISNQQIQSALASDPGATPAQILAVMQHYGVSLDQLAAATQTSADALAQEAEQAGITGAQLATVGYSSTSNPASTSTNNPANTSNGLANTGADSPAYQAWASSGQAASNPFSSPAFQAIENGALAQSPTTLPFEARYGQAGTVSAQNIKDWFSGPSIQNALVDANVNGISAGMIDSAMGWSSGTAAAKATANGVALVDMSAYAGANGATNSTDPMYSQYQQFLAKGTV